MKYRLGEKPVFEARKNKRHVKISRPNQRTWGEVAQKTWGEWATGTWADLMYKRGE